MIVADCNPSTSPGLTKAMPLRALLYRRISEPPTISIHFDGAFFLVRLRRHRQARRYTLRIHAATREVVLTMPPRGSVKEARAFAEKHGGWIAARLNRLPAPAPFADGTMLPLRGIDHRIVHRQRARGTVWIEIATGGERLLCVAGRFRARGAQDQGFSQARGETRSRGGEPGRGHAARRQDQAGFRARPVEPLGLLLDDRHPLLFVAADPGSALCSRISRRARSRASGGDEPLAKILARGRPHLPAYGSRESLARCPRCRPAPLRPRGRRQPPLAAPATSPSTPCFPPSFRVTPSRRSRRRPGAKESICCAPARSRSRLCLLR